MAAALALVLLIRTYNVFGVSESDMDRARRTTSDILRPAGIELVWAECAGHTGHARCSEPPRDDEVLLRLVAAPHPGGRRDDVLGDAYVDTAAGRGTLGTLYPDRIAALAALARVDRGTVLGRAMAHEIGHLLLGTSAHATHGIMRAEWTTATLRRQRMDDWDFLPLQAHEMHERLASRRPGDAQLAN